MKSKIISTSLIISSKIWTCIDVRVIYHRRPNAVSFNDAKDIIQPIPCSARDTNVISNEWRMFRRTEISFESITFEIRWSNCNSMVSLARDTIEVRIIDKYWWARRGDLERWKVERIKAGWRIFSVEHKEYRERERELRYWGLSMQAFLSTIQSNRLSSRLPRIVFLLARFRDTLSRTTLIETRVYGGFRDQKVSWHLASYPGGIYTVRHPRRGSPFDAICTDINGNPVRSFSCAISRQSARTWRRKEGARKNLRGICPAMSETNKRHSLSATWPRLLPIKTLFFLTVDARGIHHRGKIET